MFVTREAPHHAALIFFFFFATDVCEGYAANFDRWCLKDTWHFIITWYRLSLSRIAIVCWYQRVFWSWLLPVHASDDLTLLQLNELHFYWQFHLARRAVCTQTSGGIAVRRKRGLRYYGGTVERQSLESHRKPDAHSELPNIATNAYWTY